VRSRTAGVMKTLMRNGRDRRSENPFRATRAQAVRAILLASATATTLNGLRARSCVSQGYFSGFCFA
jgi:hypothetical protein